MTVEGSAGGGIREVLLAGGDVGLDTLAVDWAAHPLGPPESWPGSLQTVVQVVLTSRFSMWIAWGDEFDVLLQRRVPPRHARQEVPVGARALRA